MNEQHVINVKVESFENLHQLFQICRKCFQFVATLFYLQQGFFSLQQLYFTSSNVLICIMSLVGHRTMASKVVVAWRVVRILYLTG